MKNTMSTTSSVGLNFAGDSLSLQMDGLISDQEILSAYSGLPASEAREQFKKDYDSYWKNIIDKRREKRDERDNAVNLGDLVSTTVNPIVSIKSTSPIQEEEEVIPKLTKETIQYVLKLAINNNMEVIEASENNIIVSIKGIKLKIVGVK